MNEQGEALPEATVWIGRRQLTARRGPNGEHLGVVVPFSTRPGRVPMLLVHGEVTQLAHLEHPGEIVQLRAGFHLERESLVANQTARVLCRPRLTLGGSPASVELIEEPRIELSVVDLEGTTSLRTQPITLRDDREVVVELNVPEGVARLSARLRGRVRVVSTQATLDVDDGIETALNGIHTTERTSAVHLARPDGHFVLYLLGKTGEPLGGRALSLTLRHRNVHTTVTTTLETAADGAISLGALHGIAALSVALPSGETSAFTLLEETRAPRSLVVVE